MSDVARLFELIDAPPSDELARALDDLPADSRTTVARTLATSNDLAVRLSGLIMLIDAAARGSAPQQARDLAGAILFVSFKYLDDRRWAPGFMAENAAQAAGTIATAYENLGRHRAIPLLSRYIDTRLAGQTNGVSIDALQLKAVNALMSLGHLEDAEALVLALLAKGCSDPSLPIVKARLDGKIGRFAELAETRTPDQQAKDDHSRTMQMAIEAMARLATGSGMEQAAALLAAQAETADAAPQDAHEVHRRAVKSIDALGQMSGLDKAAVFQWRSRVNAASKVFFEGDAAAPADLEAALVTFNAAIAWSDANNEREDGHQARWCAYIAERRLKRPGTALDRLEDLAERLETDRRFITDPLRFPTSFPMLAAARVECADMVGDPRRMLMGIEAAKGRTLANLLRAATGKTVDEKALQLAPDAIAAIVARLGIAYVSFLAIDIAVFAVAVWPDGHWESTRIGLDEAARRRLSGRIEPATWVNPIQPKKPLDMGAELAPLVAWLRPRLGALPANGHLVFSPDGELHMWPLHMADTPEGPLGLTVGVSRVHGVDALRRIDETPPVRPDHSIAMFIPSDDEGGLAAKAEEMARTVAAVPAPMSIAAGDANEDLFRDLDASGVLLYINAHGIFPEARIQRGVDPNPYRSAGLLLSDGGALPRRSASWAHRLTPALVLESPAFRADRATVVLQGCVSGLAKEGLAGDALGLEFAFLARNADTVIASHWHVDYRSAGAFCRRFFEAWYGERTSRIEAWKRAAAGIYTNPGKVPVHEWAAFSLSGDWR